MVLKTKNGFIKKTEDAFFEMLYADALRGVDSTGIIGVEEDGRWHIMKEAVEATWFIPQVRMDAIGKDMYRDGKVYIGHNRKRTVGKADDVSSHPFVIDDNFAMVHNGTLYNHSALAKTDVDSEALAIVLKQALDAPNQKEALEETLGKVFGAYAVAMYDQKRHKVHLLRNKDRPLQMVEAPDAWFFASEGLMAGWILARNGYNYSDLKVINIEPDSLVTFDLANNTMIQEVLVPKKPTPQSHTHTVVPGASHTTGDLSKREIKRLVKQNIGKKMGFWVDDFVEYNYPLTIQKGETMVKLWGTCDDIKVAHAVEADIDLSIFQITEEEEIVNRRWIGTIEAMAYDATSGNFLVSMVNTKPVLKSVPSVRSTIEEAMAAASGKDETGSALLEVAEYNRLIEGWSDGYLTNYLGHKKEHLKSWQIAAINAELNSRKKNESTTTIH